MSALKKKQYNKIMIKMASFFCLFVKGFSGALPWKHGASDLHLHQTASNLQIQHHHVYKHNGAMFTNTPATMFTNRPATVLTNSAIMFRNTVPKR